MPGKKQNSGLTLIELVMVLVIISVIAAVSLPKMTGIKEDASKKSEDKIMSALKTAIRIKMMENTVNGVSPAYPTQASLFDLLEKPPPYQVVASFGWNSQDRLNWRLVKNIGGGPLPDQAVVQIYCPHFNGDCSATGVTSLGSKGKMWVYIIITNGAYGAYPPGDIIDYWVTGLVCF